MAFKMKGFPKHSGVGGVQAEKELKAEVKSMATDKPKTPKTEKGEGTKKVDFTSAALNEVGGFPEYEGKEIRKASKKDISALKRKKFYGDRTLREMRQDFKDHMDSLGDDKQAKKEARKYHRGRKKELRAEELERRGKTKRAKRKMKRGKKITDQFR